MARLSPGKERLIKDAQDLTPDIYRRHVAHRARKILTDRHIDIQSADDLADIENAIAAHFEKIDQGADFLPASFLREGAARADAVCRISTGTSLGTGFLVAPGILMTNNHVLSTAEDAEDSVAEFQFERGRAPIVVPIRPAALFVTHEALDFTIVACDTSGIEGVTPVPLLRNPATVAPNERVSIIQHPRGRPKEVALHNNPVTQLRDKVVHYRTDTEPGSSGSPVFNNAWDLVALHHAGWIDAGRATNEGVRISAIVAHLLGEVARGEAKQEALRPVLESIRGTSPFLGIFDLYGLGEDTREVQVDHFAGTPDFADIGVWNIEHFNASVSNDRVDRVADVVAELSMDVLGLTEVQDEAMDRLVTRLSDRGMAADYQLLNVDGRQDLAVLYDRDTTHVRLRRDIARRHASRLGAETPTGRTAFPRAPLFADCTVGNGDGEVRFIKILVHLKAFGDAQSRARRRLAAEKLAEIIDDIRDREGLPVVLGGDFNERIDTDVLSAVTGSPDLFAMTSDDANTDAISYVGDSHRSLIDHVLVTRDVALGDIHGDDAAIVRLDRTVRDFASRVSDHVPVVFRMVLRDQPVDVDEVPTLGDGLLAPVPEGASRLRLAFED